ncbi:hypothetical protein CYMTET_33232, partial [Cymbomonas tetramitiformis]
MAQLSGNACSSGLLTVKHTGRGHCATRRVAVKSQQLRPLKPFHAVKLNASRPLQRRRQISTQAKDGDEVDWDKAWKSFEKQKKTNRQQGPGAPPPRFSTS